jgi:hypothetical protein
LGISARIKFQREVDLWTALHLALGRKIATNRRGTPRIAFSDQHLVDVILRVIMHQWFSPKMYQGFTPKTYQRVDLPGGASILPVKSNADREGACQAGEKRIWTFGNCYGICKLKPAIGA